MKKKLLPIFVLIVMLISIVGCSNDSKEKEAAGGEATEETVLKLGHVWPSSEIHAQAAEEFAVEVEELSGGKLKIDIFGDSTLGADKELLEGLKVGTADIWVGGAGVLSGSSDAAKIFTVPFMFDSREHAEKVYNGEVGEEITAQILKDSGYRVLSYWERGARWLTINNEVKTPDDLKGKKVRVPESPVFVKSFETLGASPTPMSFDEVFTSIQQGVIDGQENPLSLISTAKFNEVVKYLVKTEHVREPISIVISDATYNKLSPELQEVLDKAANGKAKEFAKNEITNSEEKYLKELTEGGMTLIEPDLAAFQTKLDGFVEKQFPEILDLYEQVRANK